MKFEVKVRAGLNIARTSSSVDLTAGLGRDELGWLPPRLTFDADGRSAGEAAAGAVGGALKASHMRLNCSSIQPPCQLARASAGNFKYSDVTCFCDSLGPG